MTRKSRKGRVFDRTGINATTESLVTELVASDDAAWFESHPKQKMRERPAVEGEFHFPTEHGDVTVFGAMDRCLVVLLGPGMRARISMFPGDSRMDAINRANPQVRSFIYAALGIDEKGWTP